MRLLVDLYPCQTETRNGDIGRYTHLFVREMAQTRNSHGLIALANAAYPDRFEELRREFTGILPAGSFLPYRHQEVDAAYGEMDPHYAAASTLVRHTYETIKPDIILYPNIFEGWEEKGVVPLPGNGFPSALSSTIIYDFIPYIFSDRFLDPDPNFKKFYLKRFYSLKKFDLLLAISESTRQDAIKYLGLSPDRVVNISAAASGVFQKKDYAKYEIDALFRRFGISKPFIFYTGNGEYHKNLEMALSAYSKLPEEVRKGHQFVLTHTEDELAFRHKMRSLGLDNNEVAVTGRISDQDLAALYNSCKLYILPSLYEGSGQPVLEAMACGAPVIASNNSSIPEVMGREEAMFDASNEGNISDALYKALTDDHFRQDLSSYGLERVKQFGWEKTAQKAWSAMEEALEMSKQDKQIHVSAPANQPKLRIAYVSPLPPQKSGIADYSADLLPYLSNFVDIDLFVEPGTEVTDSSILKKYSIYPTTELVKRQRDYDTVVYHFGNSEFHRHMFQLMREVRGIVVLHDFFLSHLRAYMHSTQNSSTFQGNLTLEAGEFHGLFSMVDFVQRGISKAMWDWPLNWDVLKYAQQLVVHSSYQNTLIRKFYGRGWNPQPIVINELHNPESIISSNERMLNKQKLEIRKDSFTFCSFGFLNPAKLNLLIIEAFAQYLTIDAQATLVFVGEPSKGEFEQSLRDLITRSGISEHVRVTGFVDIETFRSYLTAADAAIQLRINSRGETSRAVLDCMAFGIPTIINAHGSLNDYHEDDVVKLNEFPKVDELVQAMIRLCKDNDFRHRVGKNAHNAIHKHHHPERVAAAFYDVILKASQTKDRVLFSPLIDALCNINDNPMNEEIQTASRLAATNLSLRNQPRILIDVTNISYNDLRTGIQRVVKNLIKELFAMHDPSIQVELVKIYDGKLYKASRFVERLFGLPEESLGKESFVNVQPGDTLFMLDSSWNLIDQFVLVFDQVRKAGGRIYTMLYDIIPVQFPQYFPISTVDAFNTWIDKAVFESDEIICISKAVVEDVEKYIHAHLSHLSHVCRLSYIHLGADIPVVREESQVRAEVRRLVDTPVSPIFLMVGTIEPRKGHAFALDAFEYLWRQGKNDRLCIVGKVGWNVEALEQRIRNHPELGNRLIFIEKATDAEVNLCYSAATALVTPSIAEGFGLPIVEAALHQVPVLASDIPVFREVGGEGALYFSLESPVCLAEAVQEMACRTPYERTELAMKVKCLSWKESAAWMLDILEHNREHNEL